MKLLVVLVVACVASPAFCGYASYGGYHGGYSHGGYNGPLASPVVTPNGFLADTPEVAAAKAAHFSEVAKTQSAPGHYAAHSAGHYAAPSAGHYAGAYDDGSYKPELYERESHSGAYSAPASYSGGYHGPLASPVVTPSGFLADTPEVAAAKAAHFSEVAKTQSAPGYYAAHSAGHYVAPSAGHYAASSAGHYAAHSAGHYAGAYDDGSYKPELYERESHSGAYSGPASYSGGYHGPLASPVVTPSGFLADTPEVAAAKAAHFSEVAKSQTHGYHGRYRRGIYQVYRPLTYTSHYVYPYAHRVYYHL